MQRGTLEEWLRPGPSPWLLSDMPRARSGCSGASTPRNRRITRKSSPPSVVSTSVVSKAGTTVAALSLPPAPAAKKRGRPRKSDAPPAPAKPRTSRRTDTKSGEPQGICALWRAAPDSQCSTERSGEPQGIAVPEPDSQCSTERSGEPQGIAVPERSGEPQCSTDRALATPCRNPPSFIDRSDYNTQLDLEQDLAATMTATDVMPIQLELDLWRERDIAPEKLPTNFLDADDTEVADGDMSSPSASDPRALGPDLAPPEPSDSTPTSEGRPCPAAASEQPPADVHMDAPMEQPSSSPLEQSETLNITRTPMRQLTKRLNKLCKRAHRLSFSNVVTMMKVNAEYGESAASLKNRRRAHKAAAAHHHRRCSRRLRAKTMGFRTSADSLGGRSRVRPSSLEVEHPTKVLDYATATLLDRLTSEDKALLASYLNSLIASATPLEVGTGCSGSDCIIDVFDSLEYALCGTRGRCYNHKFSAEKNPDIRSFIAMSRPALQCLFTCIESLEHKTAINALGGEGRATPPTVSVPSNIWCYIAGFVCKDISSLNGHCSSNRSACSSGTSRTGETWSACIKYLKRHKPSNAVFENVTALASSAGEGERSNMDICLDNLRAAGYNAVGLRLCPYGLGLPVTRARIYLIASCVLSLQELEAISDGLKAQCLEENDSSSRIPLETFLLPDGHPMIEAEYNRVLESKGRRAQAKARRTTDDGEDCKWVLEHSLPFCGSGSRVKTNRYMSATTASQWLDVLTDRELQNLATKPSTIGVAELSQSEKRETTDNKVADTCPCIIPNGVFFHLGKLRLLCPLERLSLQGIPVDEHVFDQYDADFWNELSGNSFNAYVMSAIMSSFLLIHARKAASDASSSSGGSGVAASSSGEADVVYDTLLCEGLDGIDPALALCDELLSDVHFDL